LYDKEIIYENFKGLLNNKDAYNARFGLVIFMGLGLQAKKSQIF